MSSQVVMTFEVVKWAKEIGTLIAEDPDNVYIDIIEKVGFRINFKQ